MIGAIATLLAIACGDDNGRPASPITNDGGGSNPREDQTASPNDASRSDGEMDAGPILADFGLDVRPPSTCVAPPRPSPPPDVELTRVYPNLDLPLGLTMIEMPPGNKDRWYGSQLSGKLVSFPSAGSPTTANVVADLPALAGIALGTQGESGFLGFAFHPKFQQNGRVYVTWNSADGPSNMRSRVGFLTSADGGVSFASYTNILVFDQPGVFYHHGGGITFGTDGFLYLSFGDGGDATNGSNKAGYFSKVLRLDVDNVPVGQTFGIPADNPFVDGGAGVEPALFAFGFRNPFRLSIDRPTGEVWVGDVGAGAYEEIDHLRRAAETTAGTAARVRIPIRLQRTRRLAKRCVAASSSPSSRSHAIRIPMRSSAAAFTEARRFRHWSALTCLATTRATCALRGSVQRLALRRSVRTSTAPGTRSALSRKTSMVSST